MNDGSNLRAIELSVHGRKTYLKSRVRSERILRFHLGPIYVPLRHHPGSWGGRFYSDGPPSVNRASALRELVSKTPRRRSTFLVVEQPALFVIAASQTLVVLSMSSSISQRTLLSARAKGFSSTLFGFTKFLHYAHELSNSRERTEVFTLEGQVQHEPITLGTEPRCWRLLRGGSGLKGLTSDDVLSPYLSSNLKSLLMLSLEVALAVDWSDIELLDESDLVQLEPLYYSDSELLALQTRPAPRRRKRRQKR